MFGLGITEIAIILIVLLFVFGPSRLPHIGKGIGNAIANFRNALSEKEQGEKNNLKKC